VAAGRTIVFIHGAWVTPACWDDFVGYFTERGFDCVAPAWPGKDRSVEEIRADPSPLARLGVGEIVDHYDRLIRALPEPPILVGHSFGGLFTQILLDRGLGAAGVAIDSAPPNGVFALYPTAFRALYSVLATPLSWRRVVRWSYKRFRYAFVHTLSETEARAAYDRHVTPETGRIFWQDALAWLRPGGPCRVNFANAKRAPLLMIAGGADRIVPAGINRRNYRKYSRSAAITDFRAFPGRSHWTIAQPGWEEVAGHIAGWLRERGVAVA
jgi:pimeloyl-ACP methyl ester carboxylesterase